MKSETIQIDLPGRKMDCIVLKPEKMTHPLPGILWIHGGGYALGMAGMVHMSCAKMQAKKYGAVVLTPEYRLSTEAPYASAARETDYRNLPPCYTFVSDGEPFYQETLNYVENLRKAGVKAKAHLYHGNIHAFDMLCPWLKRSRVAKRRLCKAYEKVIQRTE